MTTNGHGTDPGRRVPDEHVLGSPFPPIAEYGFLSDCETTALVAPSGNVEWLCLPRMDSPSVFGAILDRGAGGFRLGPSDINVPAARRYLPGTMVLETSWGSPGGWIIVRDVLLIGPWRHTEARSQDAAPAADGLRRRAHPAAHGAVRERRDAAHARLRAAVRVRPANPARGATPRTATTRAMCRAEGSDVELVLTSDMNIGFEGPRASARTLHQGG